MLRQKDKLAKQNPHHLLDTLIARYHLKNDAALCRMLDLAPPQISKLRNRTLAVSDAMLVRIMEVTDMGLDDVYALLYPEDATQDA